MISSLIKNKNLLIICGSGGVGKTTVAASLALKSALTGKKTLVLTIDPAKRLVTSLGLNELSDRPQKVGKNLPLYASMLDSKNTFDKLVEQYAPTASVRDSILKNIIYRELSGMVSGSQEYMAMEKLYEFVTSGEFEMIVIDTPPTIHALDFLEAPEKMMKFLDHRILGLFLKPSLFLGRKAFSFLEKGSRFILDAFEKVVGHSFLRDISEMLASFQGLLGGFQRRAKEVAEIFKDPKTVFLLVSSCDEKSVDECRLFLQKLEDKDFEVGGVLFNRVTPDFKKTEKEKKEDELVLAKTFGKPMAEKIMAQFRFLEKKAAQEAVCRKKVTSMLASQQFEAILPVFEDDIHDLKSLERLASYYP